MSPSKSPSRKRNSGSGTLTVFAFHPYLVPPSSHPPGAHPDPLLFYRFFFLPGALALSVLTSSRLHTPAFSFLFLFLFLFFFFFFLHFLLRIPVATPCSPPSPLLTRHAERERNAIPERRNTAISLMMEQRPFSVDVRLSTVALARTYMHVYTHIPSIGRSNSSIFQARSLCKKIIRHHGKTKLKEPSRKRRIAFIRE